jgi:hypothetical protein
MGRTQHMRHAVTALSVAAIGLPGAPSHAQSVRDSAGIRIVSYPASARPKAVWRLNPRPLLQIGGAAGTGPTEFSHIWGASRTPDGGVVVSDEPVQELRVFDANGRFLNRMGRQGQGPGEFSQIRNVTVHGDTVYAVDTDRGTAVFLLDGTLVRHPSPPMLPGYHAVDSWGSLGDGSAIITGAGRETREMRQRVGTRIEMRGLFRIARDSRSAKLLEVVPTFEHFRAADGPIGGQVVVFAPSFSVAVFSNHLCIGRPVRYEVRCLHPDGGVQQIIRRDVAVQPVTKAARDAVIAARRKPAPADGLHGPIPAARREQLALSTPFAASFPAYGWITGGRDGELWVGDFVLEQHTRPYWEPVPASAMRRWNVFDRDGGWLATIDIPARFAIKETGRDYVLGVTRDDDGVESVIMYRILR